MPTLLRIGPKTSLAIAVGVALLTAGVARADAKANVAASKADADATKTDVAAIWNDPIFKRQFVAGYGINAEIEPRVSPEEVLILEKVRPIMADNLARAEVELKAAMKPDCSAILDFNLGGIRFQQDRMPEALESYKTAVAKFPSFRRAWRSIGLIHVKQGEHAEAIRAFTRMIELGGGDAYAYGLLGIAYSAQEDYQPAEASYRNALLLQPDNVEWRLGLTRCVFRQEKFEDAATLLDALLARFPDKADFWLLQAHTYMGMNQTLRAAENLEILDRLGKATVDSLHTLGDIYVNESLHDLAARAYVRAIDADLTQPVARPLRAAEVLLARAAIPQAREVAAHIREVWKDTLVETDQRKLLKLDARISMAEGGGSSETAAVLEEIVKLDPLDGEALMLLGQHYTREGEHDRAIFFYERAASIDAFEVNAKVRHAQVLVTMGRFAEATPLLRRAQEVRPRDDIARYLEQVERVARGRK